MNPGSGKSGGRGARGRRDGTGRSAGTRRRTESSAHWLRRQARDPYVAAARREGYRSRAAFKLVEIDDRHRLFKPGLRVIDLGAAPGGWSQVAAARVAAARGHGQLVAVDLSEMAPLPGVTLLLADFMAPDAPARIRDALREGQADVVLSDMAAPATGHRQTDHLRVMGLAEAALDFAEQVLAPGGTFLAKVLQGGTEQALLERMKRSFRSVRHVKPGASRAESAELYVLAQGFRKAES